MNKYEDIIDLPHYVSKKHPQMTIEARAAQFAPFAALTGFEDDVKETARLTDRKIEIDEEIKKELDYKLQIIKNNISKKPLVTITYFISDDKKQGGKYVTIKAKIIKIDSDNKAILLENKNIVYIKDILNINI